MDTMFPYLFFFSFTRDTCEINSPLSFVALASASFCSL